MSDAHLTGHAITPMRAELGSRAPSDPVPDPITPPHAGEPIAVAEAIDRWSAVLSGLSAAVEECSAAHGRLEPPTWVGARADAYRTHATRVEEDLEHTRVLLTRAIRELQELTGPPGFISADPGQGDDIRPGGDEDGYDGDRYYGNPGEVVRPIDPPIGILPPPGGEEISAQVGVIVQRLLAELGAVEDSARRRHGTPWARQADLGVGRPFEPPGYRIPEPPITQSAQIRSQSPPPGITDPIPEVGPAVVDR